MKILFLLFFITIFITNTGFSQETDENSDYSLLEESGDYRQALEKLCLNLEKDSLNVQLWLEMGRLYRLNQQFKNAINAYQRAQKLEPSNPLPLLYLAKTNRLAGNRDLAIQLYHRFIRVQLSNVMALSDLASIYASINRNDSAAVFYKKLYLLDTLNVEYLQKLASNQWFSDQQQAAFVNYKKAYSLDSAYLPVVFDLARIYMNMKMQDTSIAMLKKAIRSAPTESRLYADMGTAYFSKGEYYFAFPEYEKALKLGYTGVEAIKRLAISYYSISYFEKSEKMFKMLIKKDTSDYKVCMYLGNIYNFNRQYEKANIFFQRAIDLIEPDPMVLTAIYSGMADCYKGSGQYEKAVETIKIRHENTPLQYKSPKYLFEIAELYENNVKDKTKALDYYQQYYDAIKNIDWIGKEKKDEILKKIEQMKTK
jgi:tetratricopeptide (TPR) repeat protein